MANKNLFIVVALIIVLVVVGILVFGNSNFLAENKNKTADRQAEDTFGDLPVPAEDAKEIIFTNDGFSPSPLTVKAGDTVVFVNKGTRPVWPASAQHPTHTIYPGSDIKKCGTSEQNSIFDACRALQPGESWSFRFSEIGSWNYHDHVGPTKFGKIVVQ